MVRNRSRVIIKNPEGQVETEKTPIVCYTIVRKTDQRLAQWFSMTSPVPKNVRHLDLKLMDLGF